MRLGFQKTSISRTRDTGFMAAGRHGVYREREFRDRDDDAPRRKEYFYSKDELSGRRDRLFDGDRGTNRRVRERTRDRQRDVKELDIMNGRSRSSSSPSNSGDSGRGRSKITEFTLKSDDREPGELSSGSGSDDPIFSELHLRDNHLKSEITAVNVPEKKRKFSPIIWDREEKHPKSQPRKESCNLTHSLPPLTSHARGQSAHTNLQEVARSTSSVNVHNEPSLHEVEATLGSVGSTALGSPNGLSLDSPQKQPWRHEEDVRPSEDEDYVPSRNISSSRWAGENDSPRDEGEVSDEDINNKTKIMLADEFIGSKLHMKAPSPELGELTIETSERAQSKSSSSRGASCLNELPSEGEIEMNNYTDMEIERGDEKDVCHQDSMDIELEDANDSPGKVDPVAPPQRNINMLQGCRSVDEFERLNKIDEGTYGVVYRAKNRKTGEIVALKKVKMEKEREGFPLTSLREINILLSFHHSSIVDVKEVVVGSSLDSIFMVMEYMEHDLKGLMETMKQPFTQSEVKCLMLQLLEGVKYLHDNWVLHRDLKTSNLLLNNRGELKICDFGLARQYGSPLKPYTHLVVTLWYRAPELLLGAKEYSTAIDMWSLGCIMAELLAKEPLFSGKTEIDQLDKIFKTLGTPNDKIWPGYVKLPGVRVNFTKQPYNKLREKFPPTSFSGRPTLSEAGFDLLNKLLTYDPEKRLTAEAALDHDWFREVPLPKSKEFMPTFPAQHAQDRRLRRIMRSPDPLEEQRRKELQQGALALSSTSRGERSPPLFVLSSAGHFFFICGMLTKKVPCKTRSSIWINFYKMARMMPTFIAPAFSL